MQKNKWRKTKSFSITHCTETSVSQKQSQVAFGEKFDNLLAWQNSIETNPFQEPLL